MVEMSKGQQPLAPRSTTGFFIRVSTGPWPFRPVLAPITISRRHAMPTPTPAALAREAESAALIAEIDAALQAWTRSTEQLLTLSRQTIALADAIETGMADATAELEEWFC